MSALEIRSRRRVDILGAALVAQVAGEWAALSLPDGEDEAVLMSAVCSELAVSPYARCFPELRTRRRRGLPRMRRLLP